MLYKTLHDGTLIFADGFGLTRLTPGGSAKTYGTGFAQPTAPISLGSHTPRVLLRSSYAATQVVLDVETLKVALKPRWSVEALHPVGDRFVSAYGFFDSDGQLISEYPNLWTSEAPLLEPLVLGDREKSFVYMSPDLQGELGAWYNPTEGSIAVVRFGAGETREILWRAPVRVPEGAILRLSIAETGLWLIAWTPGQGRVVALHTSLEGGARRSVELTSLTMPAVDGESILYQPDDDSVVLQKGDGEERRFELAAVIREARAKWGKKKSAPPHRSPNGPGKLAAGQGHAFFVPWHAETIIDLGEATESPRKLPSKSAKLRQALTKLLRKERGQHPTLVDLLYIVVSGNGRFSISFWAPALYGKGGSSMNEVAAIAKALEAATGQPSGGCGTQG